MPKKPTDYSNTIIYKIVCKDLLVTDKYIGHTTHFVNRKYSHKLRCNNKNDKRYNLKIYQIIRENGGFENWEMIEIEKISCNNSNEAKARERYWIEYFNSTLNSYIPNRTQKEWTETNKEHIKDYIKDWYETNKEDILKYHKEYYQKNKEIIKNKYQEQITCECGSIFMLSNKARHLTSKKHIEFNKRRKVQNQQQFREHKTETELVIDLP